MNPNAFFFSGDTVILTKPYELSQTDWRELTAHFNRLGYGLPSVDAAIDVFERLTEQGKNARQPGYILQPDQAREVRLLTGRIKRSLIPERDARAITDEAERHYGITTRPALAGYLTINGNYLDFSEGQLTRTLDHRQIHEIIDLPDEKRNAHAAMDYFMNCGNIRLMGETNGIDMIKEPNAVQYERLYDLFERAFIQTGECMVDYSNEQGLCVGSTHYHHASAAKVLADIKGYFKTYQVPVDYVDYDRDFAHAYDAYTH